MPQAEKKELSLEEQLATKRQNEKTEFEQGFKELCEKFGYSLVPEYRLTPNGMYPELSIQPTR